MKLRGELKLPPQLNCYRKGSFGRFRRCHANLQSLGRRCKIFQDLQVDCNFLMIRKISSKNYKTIRIFGRFRRSSSRSHKIYTLNHEDSQNSEEILPNLPKICIAIHLGHFIWQQNGFPYINCKVSCNFPWRKMYSHYNPGWAISEFLFCKTSKISRPGKTFKEIYSITSKIYWTTL